jgi:hypothetical protein
MKNKKILTTKNVRFDMDKFRKMKAKQAEEWRKEKGISSEPSGIDDDIITFKNSGFKEYASQSKGNEGTVTTEILSDISRKKHDETESDIPEVEEEIIIKPKRKKKSTPVEPEEME